MKIGVFGDSFADITQEHLMGWPKMLPGEVHHHAWSGTSQWWSYQQFLHHHLTYDAVVFVHASPSRWLHLPDAIPASSQYNVGYHLEHNELDELNKYFFDVFPDALRQFIHHHVFQDVNLRCQQHHQHLVNLMVHTPAEHQVPLTTSPVIWNLDGLSRQEQMQVGGEWVSITSWLYQQHLPDVRVCHLSPEHNQQVAELVIQLLQNPIMNLNHHLI